MLITQKTNKWHKPIPLLLNNKSMLKFKTTPTVNSLDIVIMLDKSGSMKGIKRDAIKSLNAQIQSFRTEADRTGILTFITLMSFNEDVSVEMDRMNVNLYKELDDSSFITHGNTALRDALNSGLDTLQSYFSTRKLLVVITDGEENSSKFASHLTLTQRLRSLPENVTVVAHGPKTSKGYLENIGIPIGNINIWEATKQSVERMTVASVTANTSLYSSYAAGATRSMNYFTPDLNNLPQEVVQTNLEDKTPNFQAVQVLSKTPIAPFVTANTGKPYRVGSAFYQLTKKETVQGFKDILIRNKANGTVWGGDGIRGMLRIPANGTIELNPASSPDYEIYVKSTSHNRNLLPNSSVLIAK